MNAADQYPVEPGMWIRTEENEKLLFLRYSSTGHWGFFSESRHHTAQEYKLLSYLLHHKGKVVSRTELIEHIYDQDFDRDSNTIEVFVTRIRKKLGADVITTIRGLGYSLDDPALPARG